MAIDPEHAQLLGELKAKAESTERNVGEIKESVKDLVAAQKIMATQMAEAKGGLKTFKWLAGGGGLAGVGALVKSILGSGGAPH